MNRRDTIAALCALAAATTPARVFAQVAPAPRWRIGVLSEAFKLPSGECRGAPKGSRLQDYLEKHGLIVERDFAAEHRCADGHAERLPELARELVMAKVDLILTYWGDAAFAARGATDRIPIVMVGGPDPVARGWARSFSRPGGNLTGFTNEIDQTDPVIVKIFELVREVIPKARRIVQLERANYVTSHAYDELRPQAAKRLGVEIPVVEIPDAAGIDEAFRKIRAMKPDALTIVSDASFMWVHARTIMDRVVKARLPVSVIGGEDSLAFFPGALFSFGVDTVDQPRRAAEYVARILKGERPGDLPIERPVRTLMAIDLKVARRLSIKIPERVLLRATKIIE